MLNREYVCETIETLLHNQWWVWVWDDFELSRSEQQLRSQSWEEGRSRQRLTSSSVCRLSGLSTSLTLYMKRYHNWYSRGNAKQHWKQDLKDALLCCGQSTALSIWRSHVRPTAQDYLSQDNLRQSWHSWHSTKLALACITLITGCSYHNHNHSLRPQLWTHSLYFKSGQHRSGDQHKTSMVTINGKQVVDIPGNAIGRCFVDFPAAAEQLHSHWFVGRNGSASNRLVGHQWCLQTQDIRQ